MTLVAASLRYDQFTFKPVLRGREGEDRMIDGRTMSRPEHRRERFFWVS